MFSNPTLMGLIAFLVVGLVVSYALGLWRSGAREAAAGMVALCGLKWREFAHVVEDLLQERGFSRSTEERSPGDGGFDLLMTRGSSRYLVSCKNGAAHHTNETLVRELANQVQLQGADGAVLATSGRVEPTAMKAASDRRVEILAGSDLWRQAKPFVPHDLRLEVENRSRTEMLKRAGLSLVLALVAGLVVSTMIPVGTESSEAAAPARASVPRAAPSEARPATVAPAAALPQIDSSLTEEQLAARRAAVAMEIRNNPVIANAAWSSKATLVVSLRQAGADVPDALFDEICRIVLQHEEQRYTRLQIESPAAEEGAAATVRWRQCR